MDGIITYTYALGAGEDLRRGNLEALRTAKKPDELLIALAQGEGIIIPNFIGVYQGREFIAHTGTPDEMNALEEVQRQAAQIARMRNSAASRSLFSHLGIIDPINPNLIYVGYNPKFWTTDLVRQSLNDKLGRVVISPTYEMPDFYGKDIGFIQRVIEKGQEVFEAGEDRERVIEMLDPDVQSIADERSLYGLTREEYAFWQMIKRTHYGHPNIITGPQVLEEFFSLNERQDTFFNQ